MMTWQEPPPRGALGARLGVNDIHVWRARLKPRDHVVTSLRLVLSADERTRADRFYFERDRRSFTVARGVLRSLLGGYLGCAPADVGFGYRDKGKPYATSPASDVAFNVSHSGDYALLAFTRGRALGVDVELRRDMSDLTSLAETSFSPSEFAVFRGLPTAQHVEAFFACWSRKEAFIKATGEGVSQLAEFDVTLRPGEPARILAVRGPSAVVRYAMHELPPIDGHAAALVIAEPPAAPTITCYGWAE